MKIIMVIFLLFYISTSAAGANTDLELKTLGRSLANYRLCSDISVELDDKAMFNYYSEMYNDGLLKVAAYSQSGAEMVNKELQMSALKLAKIDRASLGGLCLSRFDLLSRKMQENKLVEK